MNYTPAPWTIRGDTIRDERYETIAQILKQSNDFPFKETPEADANAHLIAAAPELLSALVRAKDWIATEPVEETLNDYDREIHLMVLNQINNAIKKATNEQ